MKQIGSSEIFDVNHVGNGGLGVVVPWYGYTKKNISANFHPS